ncbi:Kinesin-like protein klpA [Penicillium canariense]|uniref:Kinesin-like protein n=1 Tax=Penicillium canariense TaxID=189055 RepID=A0A9W9I0K8_9EURO|nr:Kinesin-like protein klpA [Penicillium canariense]KAJ5160917.1 Kinesin-like protein klpA [Penicillium canariense]
MEDENMPRASTRSRIPQAGLRELNPATTNSRSGMSGILPPGSIANKATSVSPTRPKTANAPEAKRSAPVTRSVVGAPKAHTRGNSYASTMSRTGSTASRSTNGTFSNTMGYGSRPASAMSRPQTSFGTRKLHGASMQRPATSLDHHAEDNAASVLGKRKDAEWDQELKEKNMEEIMARVFSRVNQSGQESQGLKEAVEVYKARINELEISRDGLSEINMTLRVEMESLKNQLSAAENTLKEAMRDQEIAMDDLDRRQRIEMESIRQAGKKEVEALSTRHQDEIRNLKRKFESEIADEKAARVRELGQLTSQSALDIQKSEIELDNKTREINAAQSQIQAMKAELDRERKSTYDLRHNLDTVSSNSVTLESTIRALKARIEFLEGGREEQSQAFEHCNQQMMDALAETEATKEKLRKEETLRRKLHNQVQELKGNIRVFCRVRPSLNSEPPSAIAPMQYPDEEGEAKEINILGPEEKSSLGSVSRKNNTFAFDRVFGPSTQNSEVFDEISQLVQSALDGYNVCIFCYGQTGSGKTHTMSSQDGMIPLAVHQIYETALSLEEKGWRYSMAGNFVEVYNENLNDLLGNPDELDKKKHEIRHDMQRGKTTITDITTVQLDSPEMVESILKNAAANRSVAATKANERSSRSHSVFILKLIGENHITGERSEGTLNLVDLAGSERLSHSGATGERLKETQNINRSLSSLGDVIAALGQGKDGGHIPYRNSKLTYLLQFSLGGNSKTLMFVMVSPLQAHLSETLTSLKFATKVHNTHIGTAKRQARVRDS